MDQHGLLRFITVSLVLAATVVQFTTAATCYYCTDDPNDSSWPIYDADCGKFDYRGNTDTLSFGGCSIRIYDNGYIDRYATIGNEDGECIYATDSTTCYCTGEYCNTDSFCADCGYPKPTPTTTEATTVTTTSSSTAGPATLKCYQCINCGHIGDDTPVIEGEYLSCVTTMVLESAEVIRGGSSKEHPDGECSQNTATLSCWCSEDLCNDITIEF